MGRDGKGEQNRGEKRIGSESDCLLGQSERILRISDSEAGVKEQKSGGVSVKEEKTFSPSETPIQP